MSQKALPDEADVLAELSGLKDAIAKSGLSITDLIAQHASMSAAKIATEGEVAKLTGDKSKLVAGASIPADLVSAANEIAALVKERDTLKSNAVTVEEAAAKKIVTLGFTAAPKVETTKTEKPLTLTEKVLAAQGCKTLAESAQKFEAAQAVNPTV